MQPGFSEALTHVLPNVQTTKSPVLPHLMPDAFVQNLQKLAPMEFQLSSVSLKYAMVYDKWKEIFNRAGIYRLVRHLSRLRGAATTAHQTFVEHHNLIKEHYTPQEGDPSGPRAKIAHSGIAYITHLTTALRTLNDIQKELGRILNQEENTYLLALLPERVFKTHERSVPIFTSTVQNLVFTTPGQLTFAPKDMLYIRSLTHPGRLKVDCYLRVTAVVIRPISNTGPLILMPPELRAPPSATATAATPQESEESLPEPRIIGTIMGPVIQTPSDASPRVMVDEPRADAEEIIAGVVRKDLPPRARNSTASTATRSPARPTFNPYKHSTPRKPPSDDRGQALVYKSSHRHTAKGNCVALTVVKAMATQTEVLAKEAESQTEERAHKSVGIQVEIETGRRSTSAQTETPWRPSSPRDFVVGYEELPPCRNPASLDQQEAVVPLPGPSAFTPRRVPVIEIVSQDDWLPSTLPEIDPAASLRSGLGLGGFQHAANDNEGFPSQADEEEEEIDVGGVGDEYLPLPPALQLDPALDPLDQPELFHAGIHGPTPRPFARPWEPN